MIHIFHLNIRIRLYTYAYGMACAARGRKRGLKGPGFHILLFLPEARAQVSVCVVFRFNLI